MSYVRSGGFSLLFMLFLGGCAPNGTVVNPWWPYPPNPAPTLPSYTEVYKYQGSRQCDGGGVPLEEMKRQLEVAGVIVTSSSCGRDGRVYPAFCGGADGKINIFTIPGNSASAAFAQGFSLLSDLPEAQRGGCY